MLQQAAVIGALAVGQTLIILTAGIDLSVGAVMVLACLVMAKLASDNRLPGVAGPADRAPRRRAGGHPQRPCSSPSSSCHPSSSRWGTLSIFTAVTLIYAQGRTISLPAGHVADVDRSRASPSAASTSPSVCS